MLLDWIIMKKSAIVINSIIVIVIVSVFTALAYKQLQPYIKLSNELNNVEKNHLYDKELAKLHQDGLPTSLAECYQRTPPPDIENAAPIYRQLKNAPSGKDELYVDSLLKHNPITQSDYSYLNSFLTNHADAYALVHQAVSRPDYYVYHDPNGDPAAILFPSLAHMRTCSRLLRIESMTILQGNNGVKAAQNMAFGFQPANHAAHEPMLIGYLVSIACNAITFKGLQDIMTRTHGDTATAEAVKQAINTSYKQQRLSNVIKTELAFQCSELAYMKKHYKPSDFNNLSGTNIKLSSAEKYHWKALIDLNGITLLQYMRPNIDAADLPYPQATQKMQQTQAAFMRLKGSKVVIASIFYPLLSKVTAHRARETATANVTLMAADVFIYKAKHGAFPDRLEQAVVNVPIDPFDLKPLKYKREGKGFVVYSVGETGKYDGKPLKQNEHETVYRYAE